MNPFQLDIITAISTKAEEAIFLKLLLKLKFNSRKIDTIFVCPFRIRTGHLYLKNSVGFTKNLFLTVGKS